MINKLTSIKFLSLFSISLLVSLFSQNASAQWSPMGSGFNGPVRAIAVVGNTLYAAGKFTMSGSTTVNNIAQWNGSAWIAMGGGTKGVNDSVNALIAFNNELYVAGAFTSAGGDVNIKYIAKWTGSAWVSVGTFNNTGRSFTNFKGTLVASGHFTSPYMNIAKYVSGTTWAAVGSSAPAGAAFCMTTHMGELYIGGYWGDPSVQYLDTATNGWVSLPSGCVGEVRGLASFKKQNQLQLYIGGNISPSGAAKLTTYLSPYGYTAPFQPFSTTDGDVNCLYTNSTHIYAGGGFKVSPFSVDILKLARYNGGTSTPWQAFGNDVMNFNNELLSLGEYNYHLIAGGRFTQFGTTTVNYIAQSSALTSTDDLNDNLVMNDFYPNPMTSNGKLEIESKNSLSNPSLSIFDIIGKEINVSVSQRSFDKGSNDVEFSVNRGNLSPGIYYYSVRDKGATIATGKIVVE